jgi:hypothetical protein
MPASKKTTKKKGSARKRHRSGGPTEKLLNSVEGFNITPEKKKKGSKKR